MNKLNKLAAMCTVALSLIFPAASRAQAIGFAATAPFAGGTFAGSFQPIWVYLVDEYGELLWYRQDSPTSAWQGPSQVGVGWDSFVDILPAGGNRYFALNPDGTLLFYVHNGFNDGSFDWTGPTTVGWGWNGFVKVFAGGEGILYAIQQDGTLLWYRYHDTDGGGWEGPNPVGWGWGQFKDVFSMGQGIIYAVQPDGTLLWYNHTGYATGAATWTGPITVGSAWQQFVKIMPAGNGVILAIQPDGTLLWYRHDNYQQGVSRVSAWGASEAPLWEGGVPIGSGWSGFLHSFAMLPLPYQAP